MNAKQKLKPGQGLRELARLVLTDDVSSRSLADYLNFLLEDRLIELDANARLWPLTLPRTVGELSAKDLSTVLISRADEIDADRQHG